MVNMKLSNYY